MIGTQSAYCHLIGPYSINVPLKEKNISDSENETTKDEGTGGRLPVPDLRELGGQVNTGHRKTE
jgi:hypothetical protein